MREGENINNLVNKFFENIDQPRFHSIEEEEHFIEMLDKLFSELDQLVHFVFSEEINEENIQQYRQKLLSSLSEDFITKLVSKSYLNHENSSESDLRGLNESAKKKAPNAEEEILKKISYIANHFLTYPKEEDMQSTITLKRQSGLIQVVGSTTGSIDLPPISQPTFAVDPTAKKKNKFDTLLAQINQLVQS